MGRPRVPLVGLRAPVIPCSLPNPPPQADPASRPQREEREGRRRRRKRLRQERAWPLFLSPTSAGRAMGGKYTRRKYEVWVCIF